MAPNRVARACRIAKNVSETKPRRSRASTGWTDLDAEGKRDDEVEHHRLGDTDRNRRDRIREAADRPAAEPDDVVREVIASLADNAPSHERWLGLTTELTLYAVRNLEASTAWAAEQRRIRSALVEALDEAMTRRGAALALPTELFVRAARALVSGATAQRQLEPGGLAAGELESAVLTVLTVLLRPAP